MANRSLVPRGATLFLLLVVAAGCVSVPSQSPTMKRVGVETVTATQLREIVLQFATEFGHAAELLGDSIRRANPNPDIQYRALQWQSMAVRNIREAALVSDPLLAMLDVWLFTVQLRSFVESPPPRYDILPGGHRAAAIELLRDQEQKARALVVRVVGEERATAFEPRLMRFAADHPIDASTLNRTSVMAADTATLRGVGGGIGGAIGATYWSMRDVADRAGSINDALGKELRWHLELLAYDLARMPAVDSTLTSVRLSLDRIAALADTLPPLVSGERAMVLDALHTELATLTRAIDAMRLGTLDAVTAERMALLEVVVRERVAVLDAITRERAAMMAEMDSIVARAIGQSENLVDHIFWRMIQLVAIVLVLLAVALAIILRARRPAEP
jgi:hypothetical protein